MPLPLIEPPLLNCANPWATSKKDLQSLFDCESTGAVTIRTSLLHGFRHDDTVHQYTFFGTDYQQQEAESDMFAGSLNTLGYSPIPLKEYIDMIPSIVADSTLPEAFRNRKVFIISVTGSVGDVLQCYQHIQEAQIRVRNPLCMEVNLSCPNIPDRPPPAYSAMHLAEYLHVLANSKSDPSIRRVAVGIKTPPYTYQGQFQTLIDALLAASTPMCPVDFITATNTLGSCLVLANESGLPLLNSASGTGIGGLAGMPVHSLSLGNVKTIRTMLDLHKVLHRIDIIGVGGVADYHGFSRMQAVGASAVGVSTAFGNIGIRVFDHIMRETSRV